jgi:penicillin-binding protein 1A
MLPRPVRITLDSAVLLVTVAVGVPVAVAVTVLAALIFLPLPATIPPAKPLATIAPSQVYDRNGNLIATFHQFDQRIPVTEKDIPTVLKEAVVSIEDRNFYKHGGVDIRGSVRALIADLRNEKTVQGGSTITQQYVKLTYTNGQRTLVRKIKEAILASRLDRASSKDEILFQYLNSIYFGDGSYGVGAASENYFRVPVSQLTLSQAAMLAGLIAAPTTWAPRENPAAAEDRRQVVLDKMLQQGYITQSQHDQAYAEPVTNERSGSGPVPGTTNVFPPQQDKPKYPAFTDYLLRYLLEKYGPQEVYQGGLRIQTTLDPAVQAEADQSVQAALKGTSEPLEMALATVEPQTGFVDAIVGGRDFGGTGPYSQDNFALGGCEAKPAATVPVEVPADCWSGNYITSRTGITGRQPGSAWKPFVLATAFAEGIPPTRVYSAPQVYTIPNCKPSPTSPCTISNNEGEGGGATDIRHATWASINTVFAQLIRDTGCVQVAQMAKKLGITSAWYSSQVHTCSGAYALGEVGVSPLDMASAYGVFDNHGKRATPTPLLKVIDGTGKVLLDNISKAPDTTQVIDPIIADNVTDVLRGVITGGTGTGADIGRPAAGKTGTTSKFTNAWFVGYTPTRSTAVWMGYANNQSTTLNLPGVGNVYGGTIPATTWKNFMSQALANVAPTDFSQPPPVESLTDQLNAQLRGNINPGAPLAAEDTPLGGPYIVGPVSPNAVPPPSTLLPTTTTPPTTKTTKPTLPPILGGTTTTTTLKR